MPTALSVLYGIETALCFLVTFHLFCYSYYIPKDFAKFGRIMRLDGMIFKLLIKLVVLFHYIVLILIAVFAAKIGTGTCKTSTHPEHESGEAWR
jgi:hypothetical protein